MADDTAARSAAWHEANDRVNTLTPRDKIVDVSADAHRSGPDDIEPEAADAGE